MGLSISRLYPDYWARMSTCRPFHTWSCGAGIVGFGDASLVVDVAVKERQSRKDQTIY
jgi:hypothetical protein